jgi:mannobiose 2-epimerase
MMTHDLRQCIEQELTGNILPFWVDHSPDPINGGFFGALSNDLKINNLAPRSAVLYGRILWTFAIAYRKYQLPQYLSMAERAYEYMQKHFWDPQYAGMVWTVNARGEPVESRKHTYAQAFSIYGLSEYYSATGDAGALELACRIFELLETHAHEPLFGGYIESRGRDWVSPSDPRLSALEPDCDKSMNTLLHLLEAYANLLRVWDEPRLRVRLEELLEVFLGYILDPQTGHFRLFFHNDWSWPHREHFSYGHDIEGSWLLEEAAETLGNAGLLQRTRSLAVQMAQAVYTAAIQSDGRVLSESSEGPQSRDLAWWTHAEAMVGFYNAYQISGQEHFSTASARVWDFIGKKFIDHEHGDWFKTLDPQAKPYPQSPKVGPWECPYHHSRACLEMLKRLN